ncbi:MAG TPA: nucleoside deaminase [Thermomicrobiales bacterium]|jgi:tRNA(Arg) A34 adenosine deaminase TadA
MAVATNGNFAITLHQSWFTLPTGARAALAEQWSGLAAGGLPCGSAIVAADDTIIALGRNRAYDPPGEIATRARYPLQHNRLAHAELNALACIPTEVDHAPLTLWTTQHPCAMCAAAIAFVGIGAVRFIAEDPSDDSSPAQIAATRAGVPYAALGDPLWWTIVNLLFLYSSAVQFGEQAGNVRANCDRYPALIALTLDLARGDTLGAAARAGIALPLALEPHYATIARVAAQRTLL